jgi:hypothetical protein
MAISTQDHKHLQAFLTDQLRKQRIEAVKGEMNAEQLTIFLAGASGQAGCWTDIIPTNDPNMQMSNSQFINSTLRRILHPDNADRQLSCGCKAQTTLDDYYAHKLNCPVAGGAGHIYTHDDVKYSLAAFCTACNMTVEVEQRMYRRRKDKNKKRMDLRLRTGGAPGLTREIIDMDVTIVNAMTSRQTNTSTTTDRNASLNAAVKSKRNKYSALCDTLGHGFLAIAFYAQGNWHEDFIEFFKTLLKLSAESERSSFAVYWRRRIAVTLQKGISNHLIVASRRINRRRHNYIKDVNLWD